MSATRKRLRGHSGGGGHMTVGGPRPGSGGGGTVEGRDHMTVGGPRPASGCGGTVEGRDHMTVGGPRPAKRLRGHRGGERPYDGGRSATPQAAAGVDGEFEGPCDGNVP